MYAITTATKSRERRKKPNFTSRNNKDATLGERERLERTRGSRATEKEGAQARSSRDEVDLPRGAGDGGSKHGGGVGLGKHTCED
ncbi:hypothetical protein BHE74_00048025 [Ensete ventricosum]|nr:hypothetical protein GW17_00030363 [Ensete ventricosum]RWW46060.1 hypothetical protein BHE74_00048025 [Ensete ventricosum]RZS19425.1 hypothetical protein BHM03_00051823 [Ensete ventricosum]